MKTISISHKMLNLEFNTQALISLIIVKKLDNYYAPNNDNNDYYSYEMWNYKLAISCKKLKNN